MSEPTEQATRDLHLRMVQEVAQLERWLADLPSALWLAEDDHDYLHVTTQPPNPGRPDAGRLPAATDSVMWEDQAHEYDGDAYDNAVPFARLGQIVAASQAVLPRVLKEWRRYRTALETIAAEAKDAQWVHDMAVGHEAPDEDMARADAWEAAGALARAALDGTAVLHGPA